MLDPQRDLALETYKRNVSGIKAHMMKNTSTLALPPIAHIGDPVELVSTPALLIDLDRFEANIRKMAELASKHAIALRPHAKAHKASAIARAQLSLGAVGICCQKLSEAYPFAAAGIQSIHISNEFVGAKRIDMAIDLARHVRLSICVDHPLQVQAIGTAARLAGVSIDVFVEVDIGQGRCGVTHPDAMIALADQIGRCPSLRFAGLQAYHGGIQHIHSWNARRQAADIAAATTAKYVQHLDSRGIVCEVVTGGGTGTAEFDAASGVYTEIQPGSYVFMDRHYGSLEWNEWERPRHSLFVAATIMSTNKQGLVVCDVGLKGVAVDSGLPLVEVGTDANGLKYIGANDEHGILEVAEGDTRDRLGERLTLIPGHCDPTANLYQNYVVIRDGIVEALWEIDARGLSQ
jgi:D-serine deaminase-like pyridoxal phosphate-dependent protein